MYKNFGIGFREWRISRWESNLTGIGVGNNYTWEPGWNSSICFSDFTQKQEPHAAPGEDYCSCGFNCYYRAAGFADKYEDEEFLPEIIREPLVFGSILFCGSARLHETGCRVEHARILGLYSPKKSLFDTGAQKYNLRLRRIACKHRVPLFKDLKKLERHAAKHGEPVIL